MVWVETVIYVALEVIRALKPRAGANEGLPVKPFWTVVPRGSTRIRIGVVVTIGTLRGYSDADADLSLSVGRGSGEADSSNRS
jgi:hypothetical protein